MQNNLSYSDPELITYQKFNSKEQATELAEIFTQEGIEHQIDDTSAMVDLTFTSNQLEIEFRVKIKKSDFERADQLVNQLYASQIEFVDKEYYLFQFTNDELYDLLIRYDEWGKFDYLLAQKILKDRKQEINDEILLRLRKNRIEELSKQEINTKPWIISGYILAVLGGILAFLIGAFLLTHKKTLPNGDLVYGFTEKDRKHGKKILYVGFAFFVFWLAIRLNMNS